MELRHDIAQRIVDRVGASLDRGVSVTNLQGLVLASTHPQLVHTYLPLETTEEASTRTQLPLVYADVVVGTLVLEDSSIHDPAVAHVVQTLAELIVHQMMVIDELQHQPWLRDAFIGELLYGRLNDAPDRVQQEAALLGIDLDLPRVVAVIDITIINAQLLDQPFTHTSLPKFTRKLWIEQNHINLVEQARSLIANHPDDIYAFIGDQWLVLLAVADQPVATAHHRIALRVRSLLHALSVDQRVLSAGVGHYYPGWAGLAQSFVDACFALETGARLHTPGGAYCREDLGLADFIWHPDRAAKADTARRLLSKLADDEDLLATLQVFLAADLSPSLAAKQLHIHRHTLTYRLNKIKSRTGLDPCKFVDAAQLHTALLLRVIEAAAH